MRSYKYAMISLLTAACAVTMACSTPEPSVEDGVEIDLTYEAKLADGTLIDRNPDDGPITFVVGTGKLQPLVENALKGLRRGEAKTFDVADAYGAYDPTKVASLPPQALTEDSKVGDVIEMVDGSSSRIKEIRPEVVVLDLNHPLAGKVVTFAVVVEDIRRPKES